MTAATRPVKLRKILQKSAELVQIDPKETYQQITVKLWGQGVVQRNEVLGSEIAANQRFVARAGQFILSRIDARNGAIGIVPEELDGAIVSNDFPLFDIDTSEILPDYLAWFSKTRQFVDLCKRASEGTTNRVRLQEDRFLASEIILPLLEKQRHIIARIEELAAKIEDGRNLNRENDKSSAFIIDSTRSRLIGEFPDRNWISLSTYVQSIENGWSPACENRPANSDEWGVLKVGAVSFGSFNPEENKALPKTLTPIPNYEVHSGDFLMCRANTTNLVGTCAIVQNTRPHLMISDKIFRFLFYDKRAVNLQYLDHILKSPALRKQIERVASGTSVTMKNISKEKVMSLLIPRHNPREQSAIVAELEELQNQIKAIKSFRSKNIIDLDNLLPDILDLAFRGEL